MARKKKSTVKKEPTGPQEYKKWKDRAEKSYGRYGKRRDYYEGRAKDEYSRYGKSMSEADRLYGRAESTYGEV